MQIHRPHPGLNKLVSQCTKLSSVICLNMPCRTHGAHKVSGILNLRQAVCCAIARRLLGVTERLLAMTTHSSVYQI